MERNRDETVTGKNSENIFIEVERERENRLNYRGFSTKDLVAVVTGPRTRERKSTRKIDSIWCNDAGETAK